MRADETTPDTRLADDPMRFNPASIRSLNELMMGALHPTNNGLTLHARLRYFDPIKRRAGVPEGVAALIEKMTDDEVAVTLVNINQLDSREVVVQAGAYGEHQFATVTGDAIELDLDASHFSVVLSPGAGSRMTIKMNRYINQPTMTFPWDRN